MRQPRAERLSVAAAALALVGGVACSDSVTAPAAPKADGPSLAIVTGTQRSQICSKGAAGAYTYSFSGRTDEIFVLPDQLAGSILVEDNPFAVPGGECVEFFQGGPTLDGFYVNQESRPTGVVLDSAVVERRFAGEDDQCNVNAAVCPQRVNPEDIRIEVFSGAGYIVSFYNTKLGGSSLDTDGDGIRDSEDNCPKV